VIRANDRWVVAWVSTMSLSVAFAAGCLGYRLGLRDSATTFYGRLETDVRQNRVLLRDPVSGCEALFLVEDARTAVDDGKPRVR